MTDEPSGPEPEGDDDPSPARALVFSQRLTKADLDDAVEELLEGLAGLPAWEAADEILAAALAGEVGLETAEEAMRRLAEAEEARVREEMRRLRAELGG